jgi:hypothetical protein
MEVSGAATDEQPPNYPLFRTTNATKNNATSTIQPPCFPSPYPYPYPYPIYSSMYASSPAHHDRYYSHGSPAHVSMSAPHGSPSHVSMPATRSIPSLTVFLQELDKEHGKDGEYMQFLESFENESLCVSHIKHLTSEQFQKMGVDRIGWQIALKKGSEKYKY